MFNQKCESFIVKRRVDRLAYELKLFVHWRIYSIISVTQLKFYFDENFYHKFKSNYSNFVKIEKNTNDWRFYVIKKILDKRIKKFERISVIQYMIKWLDWKSEYNEWRFFFYLNNCLKLMKKYEARQKANSINVRKRNVVVTLSIVVVEESLLITARQFIVVILSVSIEESFSNTTSAVAEKSFSQNASIKKKRERFRKMTSWWKMIKEIRSWKTFTNRAYHRWWKLLTADMIIDMNVNENTDLSFYLIAYWYEQNS